MIASSRLFADVSLAARIEHAECGLLRDSATAVARRRGGAGVMVQPIARGVAVHTGEGSPLNKVAGLGFAREIAVVTTLPGSKSQQNVQRLGFELLYTRAVLVLAPSE